MNPDAWRLRFRLPLAILAGGIAFTAFPPIDLGWASFAALVPLFLAFRGARGRSGFLVGLAFGLAFIGPLIWWIALFGYLGYVVLVGVLSLFFAVFGWFGAWASQHGIGRLFGMPLLFAAAEVVRTRWPLGGFAWGDLGYAQHAGLPLLPLARVGGVHLITLALAALAALAAQVLCSGRIWRRALALVAGAGIVVGALSLPLGLAGRRAGQIDVALVQGNVPAGRFHSIGDRLGRRGPEDLTIVQNHVNLSLPLAANKPDLVVWPENAVDRDPNNNPAVGALVSQTVRTVGVPFIVGAILDAKDPSHFYNVNLLYAPDGKPIQRYDKMHLVPFGEYVPWPRLRHYITALNQIPSDGIPGSAPVVFDIGKAKVGTVICFESTYPGIARDNVRDGAQFLIVSTNNASFRRSPLARQHVAMSQLRAVEEGRMVLHAAISGITAVIDPSGKILRRTSLFVPAVVRVTVPLASGRTMYGRFGDAIELGIMGLGAFAAVAAGARMIGRRRERRFSAAEMELWGGEEMLRRAVADREATERIPAEPRGDVPPVESP